MTRMVPAAVGHRVRKCVPEILMGESYPPASTASRQVRAVPDARLSSGGARVYLGLQPVADFGEAQRFGAHGGTEAVLPENRGVGGVCLKRAKIGGKGGELGGVAEHALGDQGLAVALGDGGDVDEVIFRVILHAPES